jgi:sugar/nucleoside kinase (ribokinase family)
MSILVVGDVNADLEIRLPDHGATGAHANPEPRLFPGGSAANTAAALSRLGEPCSFVGAVGDDAFGRVAIDGLADSGVDVEGVVTTGTSPTVTVIAVVQPGGDRLIYVWPPAGGAHGALLSEVAVASVPGASWLHVSGICLRTSPSREALLAAMMEARSRGTTVSFDLNLRLENWGWDDGFREVVEAAIDLSDVVMGAAADEITSLTGTDDPEAAAIELAGTERLVVARLGRDGAVAVSKEETVWSPGFDVPVMNTLGAGDAFDAGFIAARSHGETVAGALLWGNAVAALTITKPGARSSPTRREVEVLLDGAGRSTTSRPGGSAG